MEPRDRHIDLPADQEPNVIPFTTLIDVVGVRKLLASIQPQQVVGHLVSSNLPYRRQITAAIP